MSNPLNLSEKIGYSFGDLASSMFWKLFTMYLTIFYTDIVGLSPVAVGTMLLLTRIWDSINDPLMGMICDRTTTRHGKFRPFLLWGAVPFALIGVLTFSRFNFGATGNLVYAYITYTLMMMVYTAINVPYSSLMGVMTPVSSERTVLASFRFVGAFSGGILVTSTAGFLIEWFQNQGNSEATGYQYAVMIYALLAIVLFVLTYALTRERVNPKPGKRSSIREDLRDLSTNRPWFILLGAGVFSLIFLSLRDGSMMYYFKYYVGNQRIPFLGQVSWTRLASVYMTLWLASNMLGVILARSVSTRWGKKNTFLGAMILSAGISGGMFWITPGQIGLMFILNIVVGLSAGIIMPLIWAMYADVADYSEWKTGHRATGLIFSSSSMSQKMGGALGGAITLWILAAYGFHANIGQTVESLTGIRMTLSVYPALGALVSALFIGGYKLDDHYMEKIIAQLQKKRRDMHS